MQERCIARADICRPNAPSPTINWPSSRRSCGFRASAPTPDHARRHPRRGRLGRRARPGARRRGDDHGVQRAAPRRRADPRQHATPARRAGRHLLRALRRPVAGAARALGERSVLAGDPRRLALRARRRRRQGAAVGAPARRDSTSRAKGDCRSTSASAATARRRSAARRSSTSSTSTPATPTRA